MISHRCTSVGPDTSFFIKYVLVRIWLFLHRVDLCVAFCIWQDIHWVLYNALALVLLPIWWPTCLPVLLPELALAVLPLLKCSRSACLSLIPCLQRSSWLKSVKCHCGVISYCWPAMLLLLAEAEWYERKCQRRRPLHPGKAIFMKVCKSALCLLLVIYDAIWKMNEKWPAASLLFVLEYFMTFWEKNRIEIEHYFISCTQMGH